MHDIPARPRAPCPREPGRRDGTGVLPATISRVWAGGRAKNKERQRKRKRRKKSSRKISGAPTLPHQAPRHPKDPFPPGRPRPGRRATLRAKPTARKCEARSLPYCMYVHRTNTANNKSRPVFISPRVRLCTRPGPLPTSLAWAESPPACPPPGVFHAQGGRRKGGGGAGGAGRSPHEKRCGGAPPDPTG